MTRVLLILIATAVAFQPLAALDWWCSCCPATAAAAEADESSCCSQDAKPADPAEPDRGHTGDDCGSCCIALPVVGWFAPAPALAFDEVPVGSGPEVIASHADPAHATLKRPPRVGGLA